MLKKIRELTHRYAIISSVLIAVLCILLLNGTGLLFYPLPASLPVGYVQEIFIMLYSVGFVLLLGYKSTLRFKGFFKGLLCSVVVIGFVFYSLGYFFYDATTNPDKDWASTGMIIFGIVQVIGVGIREECFFRGAIQNVLARKYACSVKGVWISALICSVLFGFTHITNLFTGYNPLVVLMQILSATGTGLFLCAVYLRSGNLWAVALVHALIDLVALSKSIFLTQTRVEAVNSLGWESLFGMVIFVLPAIFLLRPSKSREIVARFDEERQKKLA